MVTTRSANKQTHLEDFAEQSSDPKSTLKRPRKTTGAKSKSSLGTSRSDGMLSPPPSPTQKRKSSPSNVKSKPSKIPKRDAKEAKAEDGSDKAITINRAPVLHLWGASVAHFLYPELAWSTCLSAGNAISTICAVAKGRSIGTIDEPEDTSERKQKKDEQRKEAEYDILEVMQFKFKQRDGKVYFSGKPQSDSENTLKKKYGEQYDEVKKVFDQGLQSWRDHEEELSKTAFGMYEDFRPNVSKGQKGWGRKGVLDLDMVRKTVSMS